MAKPITIEIDTSEAMLKMQACKDLAKELAANMVSLKETIAEATGAIDAFAEAAKKMKWQPIETAPKDGTCILVYDGEGMDVVVWGEITFSINPKMGWLKSIIVMGEYNYHESVYRPTHWMHLPAPPVNTSFKRDVQKPHAP